MQAKQNPPILTALAVQHDAKCEEIIVHSKFADVQWLTYNSNKSHVSQIAAWLYGAREALKTKCTASFASQHLPKCTCTNIISFAVARPSDLLFHYLSDIDRSHSETLSRECPTREIQVNIVAAVKTDYWYPLGVANQVLAATGIRSVQQATKYISSSSYIAFDAIARSLAQKMEAAHATSSTTIAELNVYLSEKKKKDINADDDIKVNIDTFLERKRPTLADYAQVSNILATGLSSTLCTNDKQRLLEWKRKWDPVYSREVAHDDLALT